MSDQIDDFIVDMIKNGCTPKSRSEIIADDTLRRLSTVDDKINKSSVSYKLDITPDGFAYGMYTDFKTGLTHSFHSKQKQNITPEELKKRKDDIKKSKEQARYERKKLADAAAAKAKLIWSNAELTGSNAYLDKKGIDLNGARLSRGSIIVPMYSENAIKGLQFIKDDGAKLFLKHQAKEGSYFPIAKKGEPMARILICEGFATAAALRRATGFPVVTAFDSGNLKSVAKAMRVKYPDSEIIIAADNDQWTKKPNGDHYNPGIEAAEQAAISIGGARVIYPIIDKDDPEKRTDWDDVARSDGDQAVLDAFKDVPAPEIEAVIEDCDNLALIRPLGHNKGIYSFFPSAAGQIVNLKASEMSRIQNLYLLGSRSFWEGIYNIDGKSPDSKICALASAHLMDACHKVGVFQQENLRGVGAWIDDDGRTVINCGDVIVDSNGASTKPSEYVGSHVYESGHKIIDMKTIPLEDAESKKLRHICSQISWKKEQYADLLAGWLVVSAVGSALKWRPHIWLTGRAESGKSTVIDEIIKPALGNVALKRDGGTSEPGIRKAIGTSGRPFILDEAEAESATQQADMQKILFLARRASSGGVVENAYASFNVRSAFCFAAIIPSVSEVADAGRITLLELQRDERPDRSDRFQALISLIHETLTPEYSKRLLARTINNLPTLLKNIEVFGRAASDAFGNKRSGDQIGPMLAGAYMLETTKLITSKEAKEYILSKNWDFHKDNYADSDSSKLLQNIMTARIKYDCEGMTRESTIGELVEISVDTSNIKNKMAIMALAPYGLKVLDENLLAISNQSPALKRLLQNTPYSNWSRTLGDYPEAGNNENKPVRFMAGLVNKCKTIPLDDILNDQVEVEF